MKEAYDKIYLGVAAPEG